MNIQQRTIRSLLWTLTESAGVSGLSLITLFLLARLISPAEFGVAALALSLVQLLNLFAETLFQDAIIQRKDLTDTHIATAFWTALGIGVVLSAGCFAAAPWMAGLVEKPTLGPILGPMSLSLVFNSSVAILVAKLRRELMFRPIALRSLSGRLAGSAAGIAMALYGYGLWALVAQQVAAAFLGAAVIWSSGLFQPRLIYSFRALGQLLRFAGPQSLSYLIGLSGIRLFGIVSGWFFTASVLGYLNIGLRLTDATRDMLQQAVGPLSLRLFSQKQDDRAGLANRFARATGFTCILTFPIFTVMLVAAPEVIHLALGDKWLPATPILQLMVGALFFQFARLFSQQALNAVGRTECSVILSSVDFATTVGLVFLLARYGVVWAAAVLLLRQVVLLPVGLTLVRWHLKLGYLKQLRPASMPALACVGAGGVAMLARSQWLEDSGASIRLLATAMIVGIIYLAISALFDRAALVELLTFVKAGLARAVPPAVPTQAAE